NGYGGVWQDDEVEAGVSSVPYFIGGFDRKTIHLSHTCNREVTFTLEVYENNTWKIYRNIVIPPNGYKFFIFPKYFDAEWVKIRTDNDCKATAYFHYFTRGHESNQNRRLF